MKLYGVFAIIFLLTISIESKSQWQVIEGTENWNAWDIEITNTHIFCSSMAEIGRLTKISLEDHLISVVPGPDGSTWNQVGYSGLKIIDEHILFAGNNEVWISHDGGETFSNVQDINQSNNISNPIFYFNALDGNFFVGRDEQMAISTDFGESFEFHSFSPSDDNPPAVALLMQSDSVMISSHDGVALLPIDGSDELELSNPGEALWHAEQIGDTIVAASDRDIYQSYNGGDDWVMVNEEVYAYPVWINDMDVFEGKVFLGVSGYGVQVSFDKGQSFLPINLGFTGQFTSVWDIEFHDGMIYASTGSGVFYRPVSEIEIHKVYGNAFYDRNENGVKDPSEVGVSNVLAHLKNSDFYYSTQEDGDFYFEFADISDTAVAHIQNEIFEISPNYHYLENIADTISFALIADSTIQSLEISISPLSNSRPGFTTRFAVDVRNNGVGHVNADLSVIMDPIMDITQVEFEGSELTDSLLSWTHFFEPLSDTTFYLRASVPPDVELLGSYISFTAAVDPVEADISPHDNRASHVQMITGAYDPNDKTVFPSGDIGPEFIADERPLDYLIRFQNTGNDTAFTVLITDTLDEFLDITSFNFKGSSHDCTIEIDSVRALKFLFNDILLPDSGANLEASNGYIRFSMTPKSSLNLGDSIVNTANIYFDFNPPIITNTVSTLLREPENGENQIQLVSESSFCENGYTLDLYAPHSNFKMASYTGSFPPSPDGTHSIPIDLHETGQFDVILKIDKFLSQGFNGVDFSAESEKVLDLNLSAGDLNNDNTIGISDFSQFSNQYGLGSTDDGYNNSADLNCDLEVNLVDFSLFSASFGLSGPSLPSEIE